MKTNLYITYLDMGLSNYMNFRMPMYRSIDAALLDNKIYRLKKYSCVLTDI